MKNLLMIIFLYILFILPQAWSFPNCPESPALLSNIDKVPSWSNCYGIIDFNVGEFSGDKYVGEFKDDTFHGQGSYTFADGENYVGEFKDGFYHGQGTLTFTNGDKFVGEYKNGKKHGQGIYTHANGDNYVGEYKNGIRHGQGTFTFADGANYVGNFKDEKRHGQGTYTFSDGRVWQGQWRNDEWVSGNKYAAGEYNQLSNLPNCPGSPALVSNIDKVPFWSNCYGIININIGEYSGDISEAEYIDDKRNGIGIYKYADGSKYVGQFKDDMRHGQGTFTHASGDKYVGEFKNDKRHGQGTYTFPDGENYIGEFKNGKKHGQGIYTYASGANYVGEFKDDLYHGQGTFTYPNGETYIGEYKSDKRYGQGTYTFADGRVWQGQWRNDEWVSGNKYAAGEYNLLSNLPNCPGSPALISNIDKVPFWSNCYGILDFNVGDFYGDKYIGEFKDDLYHGQGTYTFADGENYVGEYKNGKSHGQGTHTFSDGENYVGEFKDGLYHGQGTYTYPNGQKYVGEFRDDKRHGQGTYTFPDGENYIGEFESDLYHGQGILTHADGRVWQGQWRNDEWVSGNKYAAGEYNQLSNLPNCPGSPQTDGFVKIWNNCVGTYISTIDQELGNKEINAFFPRGSKYTGKWQNNMPNGQGTASWADNSKYVGEFKDDKFHGQGTYTWPDGSKYVGEYKNHKINGQGRYTFTNGDEYVGESKDDKFHGQGTYTYADGRVWQGQWRNDEWVSGNKYAAGETDKPVETEIDKEKNNPDATINAASGSGFIVSKSGHIITNNHVIDGCNEVKVHYNGDQYKASILAKDEYNDLALLKASIKPLTVLPIKKGNAELMEDIYVAGYPFGEFYNSSVKITKGIVSSLSGFQNNYSNMQIDAALQPGNSGGPVINNQGIVVGVAVAKLDLFTIVEIFDSVPENTNFAIKSSILLNFLNANGVDAKTPTIESISRSELSEKITKGTLFISCWMTYAKIEEMKSEKVIFNNLIK